MARSRKQMDSDFEKTAHITSCTIFWENTADILRVTTRILPKEVQVRFYSGDSLLNGRIWPLSNQQKQELFRLLDKCIQEWDCEDYAVEPCNGPHWQFKMCTKGRCLKNISGTIEPPPHGQEIKEIIARIIGEENCCFW